MMEKRYLSPLELLKIATQHAYSAEHLLKHFHNKRPHSDIDYYDALTPVTSLIYKAFVLTFKAYIIHEQRHIKQHKTLQQLIELNDHLGFSHQDRYLFKLLSKQQSFVKGISHDLWESPEQLQIFCEEILDLYESVQNLMPLELQSDYHAA